MFPESLQGLRAALVGYGRAHRALGRRLRLEGAKVEAFDRREAAGRAAFEDGVQGVFGEGYLAALGASRWDFAFLTPGMRKDLPELGALERSGTRLTSETAYFFARRRLPVLGVTGSAGKTTTTTLVGRMLAREGIRALVCGNIGLPLTQAMADEEEASLYVAELSSFQLQNLEASPEIAAILNISPNHLDVHPSFEDYAQSKWRIARHQAAGGRVVLPRALAVQAPPLPGEVSVFDAQGPADACVDGGMITLRGRALLEEGELPLPGRHNVMNTLAAALLAEAAGAGDEAIREELREFRGVSHRLELVGEAGGVRYVNDSIATAPDRALAAFDALQGPFVWLAGGYDKHLDYRELARRAAGVREAFLFGPVGAILLPLLEAQGVRAARREGFDDAVRAAIAAARRGDTVLLSPAAASFDEFRSFEERGERFRALVREALGL